MSMFLERVRRALAPEYEVERERGGGGMGVVFEARDPALGRRVAVKVLRPETATAAATERFRREGQTLASASHPNVVTIYQADVTGDGLSYLVMELFDESLAERLRGGRLPEEQALEIGRQLLDGLAHLHRLGIIHRDVKPGNVFLRGDRAVLGDFGIAKRPESGDETITQDGWRPGTPIYMPPETELTPRYDIYAMASVIYEMLTGRCWQRAGEARRPRAWRDVRRPVARVVRRALEEDPSERWPDAGAFARALQQAGRPPAVGGWLGALTVAALVLIIGVLVSDGGDARPAPAIADVAVLPLRAAPADSLIALKVAHATSEHLEHAFRDTSLRVTPMPLASRWWGQQATRTSLPATAFDELHTLRVAWGRLERAGEGYRVVLELRDSTGAVAVASRSLTAGAETDVGFGLAQAIVEAIDPARAREFVGSPLRGRNAAAVDSLMAGDRAFWRENWAAAERLYRAAIAIDPDLGRAWWGLYNVERWRRGGFDVDLDSVYARYPADFQGLDALLVEADLASGAARLRGYERAGRAFPNHAYPWLLLGNELFHRGPLLGIPLDSAVAVLHRAAERDAFMAPVFSTMTWALIRLGDSAGSRRALDSYAMLASESTQLEFCFSCVLRLAHVARFAPARLGEELGDLLQASSGAGSLARALRWGLSFGVPEGQEAVAERLAAEAPDAAARGNALVGQALALVALGRIHAALAHLDSAARVTDDPELLLQAAEWRVLFPALGLPGVDAAGRAAGEAVLRRAAQDPGPPRARARWALALDAFARGDAASGSAWADSLRAIDDPPTLPAALAAAYEAAAAGRTAEALRRTTLPPVIAHDGGPGDPLARAALHLARGQWLRSIDADAAARALRWYENSDAVGWPAGPPQAAELDWALEAFGRYRRAVLADETGDRDTVCSLLPEVLRRWRNADPAYAPLRARAAVLMGRCPP